jgi:hypothetical protein
VRGYQAAKERGTNPAVVATIVASRTPAGVGEATHCPCAIRAQVASPQLNQGGPHETGTAGTRLLPGPLCLRRRQQWKPREQVMVGQRIALLGPLALWGALVGCGRSSEGQSHKARPAPASAQTPSVASTSTVTPDPLDPCTWATTDEINRTLTASLGEGTKRNDELRQVVTCKWTQSSPIGILDSATAGQVQLLAAQVAKRAKQRSAALEPSWGRGLGVKGRGLWPPRLEQARANGRGLRRPPGT